MYLTLLKDGKIIKGLNLEEGERFFDLDAKKASIRTNPITTPHTEKDGVKWDNLLLSFSVDDGPFIVDDEDGEIYFNINISENALLRRIHRIHREERKVSIDTKLMIYYDRNTRNWEPIV